MTQTVLILGGSGKIGKHASEAFGAAGWTVRQYDRKTNDMTAAAMGADVIVNGLNPPNYANWAKNIPAITAQVIAAARASGATVIIPGNVYNFGDTPGIWDENTAQRPVTRKGKIRVEMEQAYAASGVQVIVLRAGNFIDPDHNGDVMSLVLMRDITAGKLTYSDDADAVQAYAYVPDWARAAVMLAATRRDLPRFSDVPFPGHAFTARALRDVVSEATGRSIKLAQFPWWLMIALSPFMEVARELREMRYLYRLPHQLSAEKFNRLLPGFQPTPLREVMLAGLPGDIHPNKMVRTGGQTIIAE